MSTTTRDAPGLTAEDRRFLEPRQLAFLPQDRRRDGFDSDVVRLHHQTREDR